MDVELVNDSQKSSEAIKKNYCRMQNMGMLMKHPLANKHSY
jgi:hypothetical protein